MKQRVMVFVFVMALIVVFGGASLAGVVEKNDTIDDPIHIALFEYSINKAEEMGEILSNSQLMNQLRELGFITAEGCEKIEQIDFRAPYSAAIMVTTSDFDGNSFWQENYGQDSSTNDVAPLIEPSLCFYQMYRTNAFKGTHGFANIANCLSIYDILDMEGFGKVSYVLLAYSPEVPSIVTAFCDMGNGVIITKTEMVQLSEEYSNEFFRFNDIIWGEGAMDTFIYRLKAK